MISFLSVRNFKLADKVELEFQPGFTALTGETGAGKSLIIDALGLLLGDRAQADTIAAGSDRAEFQAQLQIPEGHPARIWLQDRELLPDDECILRRVLSRSSASRAFINGVAVAVQDLKQLGDLLVDVHGQHEHQQLLSRTNQRAMLDAFAGITEDVNRLAALHDEIGQLTARLERIANRRSEDRERAELLQFQIRELESLELSPEKDAQIEGDFNRLAHAQDLLQGVTAVLDSLADADETNVSGQLGKARQVLDSLARHDDELTSMAERIDTVTIEVAELTADLRQRLGDYEFDPSEFDYLQRRLDLLHGASRKYRTDITGLAEVLEKCRSELSEIAGDDDTISAIEKDLDAKWKEFRGKAEQIGSQRAEAAGAISKRVEKQLDDLGMSGSTFSVRLETLETPRKHGLESVEFLIATNAGQTPGPLSRVASGGELSRVALAINMIMNQGASAVTQIYDEVDVGIGGRVAEMVGKKLRALAKERQVLCVTHLPQVASQAEHHQRVRKFPGEARAMVIEPLDDAERRAEIARMLGGIEITERTLEHAGEMLDKAKQ